MICCAESLTSEPRWGEARRAPLHRALRLRLSMPGWRPIATEAASENRLACESLWTVRASAGDADRPERCEGASARKKNLLVHMRRVRPRQAPCGGLLRAARLCSHCREAPMLLQEVPMLQAQLEFISPRRKHRVAAKSAMRCRGRRAGEARNACGTGTPGRHHSLSRVAVCLVVR